LPSPSAPSSSVRNHAPTARTTWADFATPVDPKKTIRLILSYPASTGRNTAEVLRVLDSLQTGDKHRITTPINWVPGDDVIVHPGVKNEEAKTLFPDFRIVKPYLR
jgi:alkyl hydroperoxide reductase subunit AhpC